LLDVCKALKIKELMRGLVLLSYVFSKMARKPKATLKTTLKTQTLENQALEKFFRVKPKPLKIKRLRDVSKALKIKRLMRFLGF